MKHHLVFLVAMVTCHMQREIGITLRYSIAFSGVISDEESRDGGRRNPFLTTLTHPH